MSSEKHDAQHHNQQQEKRKAAKDVKEAKETAKNKASHAAHDAHDAVDKAHDEVKKHLDEYEGILKPYWDKLVEIVNAVASKTVGVTQATVSTVAANTSKATTIVLHELQNPVVAFNTLLGAASITTLLNGYANKRRFLKGKSDKDIALIVSGLSAFIAADAYVSYYNYKRFDKRH
ncbi:Om14 [Kluyveromyces lactis]|uniref:KLLA0F09790p n=1 Tax=Kluyveromyces lactis (strain ATCC 8585 / CBS 2359 / DSM 70799 / NBRC 1267 / NRRL Y-1140 / WM37) TaxID=284590 RepID=Q6CKL4_KLULA|nr:uncharacterized protein KLLA0_F09790g [Kluyveromyces lactis]QEU59223.1 Om14 [Kluyveromyces lactis]CAG98233.1 KLLA0F09790p [Kluyveromyces lactis]|eukprot:XP_455525.1 uncharacterized protein KLLA0_F09790g [Kluyveromyces lactis]